MYEAYNPETGEIERVDIDELNHRLAIGTLVSSLDDSEPKKRTRKPKAVADENQS